MTKLAIVLFSFILLATAAAVARRDSSWASNSIQLPSDAANGLRDVYVRNCESFRLAVEANNFRNWKQLPEQCVTHVANYMLNKYTDQLADPRYVEDVDLVVDLAVDYLRTVTPTEGGSDTWLFGLTNTLLSDIEYYNRSDIRFGASVYNKTDKYEWYATGKMPAVPHIDDLFYEAKNKGFKIVILSGVPESLRSVVEANLHKVNFWGWDKLILKDNPSMGTNDFKASTRAQLKKEGYQVIGNIGDQWTDLLTGDTAAGNRTFKLPNPMYYVS